MIAIVLAAIYVIAALSLTTIVVIVAAVAADYTRSAKISFTRSRLALTPPIPYA